MEEVKDGKLVKHIQENSIPIEEGKAGNFENLMQKNLKSKTEVNEAKLISYICIIESAKYKDISVETKKIYPKSICEITEYMIINKSVE